jgi:hypothetical protein
MCVVSNIGDYAKDNIPLQHPWVITTTTGAEVSRSEFEALKAEMLELKELLKAAKKFDEATGQPDCELDEKVAMLKKFAELVGVDLSEIFGKSPKKKKK